MQSAAMDSSRPAFSRSPPPVLPEGGLVHDVDGEASALHLLDMCPETGNTFASSAADASFHRLPVTPRPPPVCQQLPLAFS
jgi:hypothetical protein